MFLSEIVTLNINQKWKVYNKTEIKLESDNVLVRTLLGNRGWTLFTNCLSNTTLHAPKSNPFKHSVRAPRKKVEELFGANLFLRFKKPHTKKNKTVEYLRQCFIILCFR